MGGGRLAESLPWGRRPEKAQCVQSTHNAPHTKTDTTVDTCRHTTSRSHQSATLTRSARTSTLRTRDCLWLCVSLPKFVCYAPCCTVCPSVFPTHSQVDIVCFDTMRSSSQGDVVFRRALSLVKAVEESGRAARVGRPSLAPLFSSCKLSEARPLQGGEADARA